MATPNFALMWTNFPDHGRYPTLTSLFKMIGGQLAKNIDVPGFGPNGNTCAVRLCRALNYGGLPISSKLLASLKLNRRTLTGADKMLYLFRVRELRTYLGRALGVTPEIVLKDFDTAFSGKRGIVAFSVEGWSNATGHLALWNGDKFKEPDHDDYRVLKDDPSTPTIREPETTKMTLWPL